MRITVAAVGRLRRGPEYELVEKYRRLIRWSIEFQEIDVKRAMPAAEKQAREGVLLLEAVPKSAATIALDATGTSQTSETFAEQMRRWQDDGRNVAFLIGGADGLDRAIFGQIERKLAFGSMTWPHRLARCMLVEQIYRAQQILAGHPYHKG